MPGDVETILLVEDNPTLRALARLVLHRQGCTVIEAADGEEAILVGDRYSGQIDLVLSDVVMPKVSGSKAVEQLVKMRLSVQVLYLSGFTDDTIVQHGVLPADVGFIQKPFTPAELGQNEREMLDGASALAG